MFSFVGRKIIFFILIINAARHSFLWCLKHYLRHKLELNRVIKIPEWEDFTKLEWIYTSLQQKKHELGFKI